MTLLARAAALLLSFTAALTASAQTLTLSAAVDEALRRHPSIAAADARQRVSRARESEARAGRLPRIEASESFTRGNNPVFVFGSLLEQGRFGAQHFDPGFLNAPAAWTNHRAAIGLRVPLFDALRTTTAVRQSRHDVARATIERNDAEQRLRADVIARYYGVVVAAERVTVAASAVQSAREDARATRDRVAQGLLVESDALSADVQLASFRQRLIRAEGDLAIARASLATVLQRSDAVVAAALPEAKLEVTGADDAVARALARRAPVKLAESFAADTRLRLTAARASALPRVDAFGSYGGSGSTFNRRNTDSTGGIAITLDVFDHGRSSRIAAARAEIDAARAEEAMARDAVTLETITAWHRLRAARESAAVAAGAVAHAEEAARIVRDRYEQGLTTITEQLRAQTALVSSRFDLLAARYESLVAQAELLRATGDLDDVQLFL